ncbi:MAG TPA: PDZ domain-containing protein [Holophagaceae bacterium]|nr:PDZ domain-containing protein [Holophagaceae bacterium]
MASAAKPPAPLKATVRPLDLAQHQVEVALELPKDAVAKGGVLALPAWTPGSYLVRDYARFLDRVVLTDAAGREVPVEKVDKQRWKLPALKEGGTLRYRIYGNDLSVRTNHIDASHAHLVAAATIPYLEGQLQRPYEIRFERFPDAWKVATGLPEAGGAYRAQDYDTLVDSPFELGSFRLHRFHALNADFEVAVTGQHNGDEARIVDGIQKVVTSAGNVFGGSFPFERYVFLLTFSPKSGGGLEHRNSTSLLSDSFLFEKAEGYHRLFSLVAHEFFHAWNVKRLHDPVLGPFDYSGENYTRLLWFHEGFTSYMEDVITLRAGVVPWSFVAREIGNGWTQYFQRPGRLEQSLEESSFDAWIRFYKPSEFSANSTIGYYEKGQLVGWLMEAALRKATGGKQGVPDLFALLWRERGEKGLRDADIRAAFHELSGLDPEPFWNAYIRGTAELDASAIEQAFGLKLEAKAPWELLPPEEQKDPVAVAHAKAWTGLVFAGPEGAPGSTGAPAPATVQNVIPGSPADAAGLAFGMEILAVDGWRTATAQEAQKRLSDTPVGGAVEVLAVGRGRTFQVKLGVVENPVRTYRLVPSPLASEAQRAAFTAWTGQPFPPLPPVTPKPVEARPK